MNSFGLFGHSGLEVGHTILLINGEIPTKSNVRDILKSLGSGDVSLMLWNDYHHHRCHQIIMMNPATLC